jgi:hypothetical protein
MLAAAHNPHIQPTRQTHLPRSIYSTLLPRAATGSASGIRDIDVGRSAASIDSRWESPMHDLHRVAAGPKSSTRNTSNVRNGVRARARSFFLAIPNQSGKSSSLSGKNSNLLVTGTRLFSCGQRGISRQQVWNLHRQPCSCKEQACSLSGQGCPAKEQRWNLHGQCCPAKEQAWNFPGLVHPAKKQAWYFPAQAATLAARFLARRDTFGSTNRKLRSAAEKSKVGRAEARLQQTTSRAD